MRSTSKASTSLTTVPASPAAPIARGPAAKAKAAKSAGKAKAAKPEAKAKKPEAKAPKAHEIAPSYTGPSNGFNASRSRSTLRLDIGSGAFTYRDDSTLRDIVAKYAGKPFARLNTDAGIIRRLASASCLTVSGNGTELTVTKTGLSYVAKSKALQPGDKIPLQSVADTAKR